MNEIATIPIEAAALLQECTAQLSFVFGVYLPILFEFVLPVRKLAFAVVRAESVFHIFFAELRFLFARTVGRLHHLSRRSLRSVSGWRVMSSLFEAV